MRGQAGEPFAARSLPPTPPHGSTPLARTRDPVPLEYLRQRFELRPNDGLLIWLTRPLEHFATRGAWATWNKRFAGEAVALPIKDGYLRTRLNGRDISVHHIVFALTTGAWPADEIDHRDGDPGNNRPSNLREATRVEQNQNRKLRDDNTSGFEGVSWHRRDRRWQAAIKVQLRRIHLGYFVTPEAARTAYLAAKREFHPLQPEPRPLFPCPALPTR